MRWKNERKVRAWLMKAQTKWGTPVRVFVDGKLMGEALGKKDKSWLDQEQSS